MKDLYDREQAAGFSCYPCVNLVYGFSGKSVNVGRCEQSLSILFASRFLSEEYDKVIGRASQFRRAPVKNREQ